MESFSMINKAFLFLDDYSRNIMTFSLRHRSSSPIGNHNQTFILKDFPDDLDLDDDVLLKTGDSTRSLLTPLYASNYDSFECTSSPEKLREQQVQQCVTGKSNAALNTTKTIASKASSTSSKSSTRTKPPSKSSRRSSTTKNCADTAKSSDSSSSSSSSSSEEDVSENNQNGLIISMNTQTKSWEDWLLKKTLEDVERLKLKKEQEKRGALKKKLVLEEKNIRKLQANENRKGWLKKKSYEQQKLTKENAAHMEYEKLKKQQEKNLLQVKSQENYNLWYTNMTEREKEKKIKCKQQQKMKEEINLNKKKASEEAYNKWLKDVKKRNKNQRNTYGYSGGALFSYYDTGASPAPSYLNPVPWVNSLVDDGKSGSVNEKYSSPPLMWKEIDDREQRKVLKRTKRDRIRNKHSCVNIASMYT